MGEKIKTILKGKLFNTNFEIELNHPPFRGLDEQVHIQSDKFRIEIDKNEYLQYAMSVLLARKNLKILKKIE
ncbi:hypothetical protein KY334_05560 [Candidatus Woesearchaeota archaeon]|nr:hypothetical protein [Candidatus Woesearchaeota archaeon]